MSVTQRRIRRTILCGVAATIAVATTGCFNVEEVAQAPAGAEASSAEELSVSFGEEVGPLDANVDGTLGDVSDAGAAPARSSTMPFGASVRPAGATFASPEPDAEAVPDPPALNDSDFSASAPALVAVPSAPFSSGPSTTEPLESTAPALPSFGSSDASSFGAGDFQPPAAQSQLNPSAVSGNIPSLDELIEQANARESMPAPVGDANATDFAAGPTTLADPDKSVPVAPMPDPQGGLAAIEEAPAEPATPEADASESATLEGPEAVAEAHETPAESSDQFAGPSAPALTIETPPALEETEAPAETLAHGDSEELPAAEAVTDAAVPATPAETPDTAVADAALPAAEAPTTPFEEDDFAPRFGPGRLVESTPAEAPSANGQTPATIATDEGAAETPSVLAQQSASPGPTDLAVQIYDPAGLPPASLRPSGSTAGTLPDFDPTRGANLIAPDGEDLNNDLQGILDKEAADLVPGATAPTPGPAGSAIPMPGPARDPILSGASPAPAPGPATSNAVPSPPSVLPKAETSAPKRASTPAEIAEASRTWTDASGSHSLEAAILELQNGEVRLETPKGERFLVSVSSLSRYDQGYVKGLAEGTVGKEPANRSWTDASGEFGVLGKLAERSGDVVRIVRDDGKRVRIEKDLLSEYDQGFLDGIAQSKNEQ